VAVIRSPPKFNSFCGSPLYEHERCHNPYFIRQIKIFEFIEEFVAFKAW
jgi:hypothetical protein